MADPKAEHDNVVAARWLPVEEIREHEIDTIGEWAEPVFALFDHLLGRVDGGHPRGVGGESLGPQPGAGRELECLRAVERERVERGSHFLGFCVPPAGGIGTAVIATLAHPPLVVFTGTSTVVGDLLEENRTEVLRQSEDSSLLVMSR